MATFPLFSGIPVLSRFSCLIRFERFKNGSRVNVIFSRSGRGTGLKILSMHIRVSFCTYFWNRISSHAAPVPMPILSQRYFLAFWFSTILCHFGFSLVCFWSGLTPYLLEGWGKKCPFLYEYRHRFLHTFLDINLSPVKIWIWRFGYFLSYTDFCYDTFWLVFDQKC